MCVCVCVCVYVCVCETGLALSADATAMKGQPSGRLSLNGSLSFKKEIYIYNVKRYVCNLWNMWVLVSYN